MTKFVKIKKIFDNSIERTLESLSKIYQDREFIYKIIDEITSSELSYEVVKGKRVLLKPNWVYHSKNQTDEFCLRTHNNFLLAILESVLIKKPEKVLIGDAPIQSADWDKIVSNDFIYLVNGLSCKYDIPIHIKDFRRVIFNPKFNNSLREKNPISDYVIFDLGTDSYLEPLSYDRNHHFRVTDYDPRKLAESHGPAIHKYCITKELFKNDIIINIPKVKTHQKSGLTNALKNLVGLNGDKDYLPHHRIGGTGRGGDCYPGNSKLRYLSELILDEANKRQGRSVYKFLRHLSAIIWKISFPSPMHNLSAAWYGNDTTWRMTLDINKIAEYGDINGMIRSLPQRRILSICDGIIGGQGDGPLNPDPLPLGMVCFSDNSAMTDVVMGYLMDFDVNKIFLLKSVFGNVIKDKIKLSLNDADISLSDLKLYSIKTIPPSGWVGYLDN